MTPPKEFVFQTPNYWVLAEVPSSSGNGTYEIRTSKNDSKTYCTCKGWIFKARKGDGICKHIAQYKRAKPAEAVVVYSFDEFVRVKRSLAIVTDTVAVKKNASVRRA